MFGITRYFDQTDVTLFALVHHELVQKSQSGHRDAVSADDGGAGRISSPDTQDPDQSCEGYGFQFEPRGTKKAGSCENEE